MSFIRVFPLEEIENFSAAHFGLGHPARCAAIRHFGARELYLHVDEIAAFEECPLYLINAEETDALVNGVRLRLRSGATLVVADDPGEGGEPFLELIARASRGEVVHMDFSRYLRELDRVARKSGQEQLPG